MRAMLFATRASGWSILIRLLVGLVVFLPEGIQKLIFPEILGAGRFMHIGIPYPDLMGPFVGLFEIVCGALIIVGLLTRLAAFPLIVITLVAIAGRAPGLSTAFRGERPAYASRSPTARIIAAAESRAKRFCTLRVHGRPSRARMCRGREKANMSYQTPPSRFRSTRNRSSPDSAWPGNVP